MHHLGARLSLASVDVCPAFTGCLTFEESFRPILAARLMPKCHRAQLSQTTAARRPVRLRRHSRNGDGVRRAPGQARGDLRRACTSSGASGDGIPGDAVPEPLNVE